MTIDSHLYSSESVFCSVPSYTPLWFKLPLLYSTLLYSSLSFILFESNIFCEYLLFSWHLLSSTLFSYLLLSSVVSSSLPLSSPLFYSLLFSSFRLYHDPTPQDGEMEKRGGANDTDNANKEEGDNKIPPSSSSSVNTNTAMANRNVMVCQEDSTITFRTFTNNGADESSAALICLKVRVGIWEKDDGNKSEGGWE